MAFSRDGYLVRLDAVAHVASGVPDRSCVLRDAVVRRCSYGDVIDSRPGVPASVPAAKAILAVILLEGGVAPSPSSVDRNFDSPHAAAPVERDAAKRYQPGPNGRSVCNVRNERSYV